MAEDRQAVREGLLLAALPHVLFDGWTMAALTKGAADRGMEPVAVRRYFPGGPAEAVRLFSDWADERMLEAIEAADTAAMRVRDRIAFAVWVRLEALAPHHEAARRAFSYLAMPANAGLAAGCLYRTVDAIWYGIGDRSADFSFYTKRALLTGVVSATMLYWLQDRSEGFAETRAFLDRRIADVMRLQRVTGRAGEFASKLPDPFRLARLMGERR